MDEPVKIVAVEESQVVIERDGKRELLERKYVDEHWTDYERLLHPEEEEKRRNVSSVWQKNPVGADEVRKEYAGRHGTA